MQLLSSQSANLHSLGLLTAAGECCILAYILLAGPVCYSDHCQSPPDSHHRHVVVAVAVPNGGYHLPDKAESNHYEVSLHICFNVGVESR